MSGSSVIVVSIPAGCIVSMADSGLNCVSCGNTNKKQNNTNCCRPMVMGGWQLAEIQVKSVDLLIEDR